MRTMIILGMLAGPLLAAGRFTNEEGTGKVQRTPGGMTITVLETPSQKWKDRAALTPKPKPAYLLIKKLRLASGKQVIVQETSRQQELTAAEITELQGLGYEIEGVELH